MQVGSSLLSLEAEEVAEDLGEIFQEVEVALVALVVEVLEVVERVAAGR